MGALVTPDGATERDPQYWSCGRKVAFSTVRHARAELKRVPNPRAQDQEIYLCKFCGYYHLGNPRRRR